MKLKITSTIIFTALAAVLFIPLPKRLCIIKYENSKIVKIFAANTDNFILSYTHSVNLGSVRDYYELTDKDTICLTHTAFTSYGAGMPEPSGDQIFNVTDDAFEISNINLELPELILQTGLTANHQIDTAAEKIVFNDIIAPQTRIIIKIKKVAYYDLLRFYSD